MDWLTHAYESYVVQRLQVIVQDPEYRESQRAARARRMSIAEWVRQALSAARRREPQGDVDQGTCGHPGCCPARIAERRHQDHIGRD